MQVQDTMPTLHVKSLWVGFYLDMTPSDLLKSANLIARKKFTRAGLLKIIRENEERERMSIRTEEEFLATLTPEQLKKRNQTSEDLEALLPQEEFDKLTTEEQWEWLVENEAGYDNSLWFESNYTPEEEAFYAPLSAGCTENCPSCCGLCNGSK
jgi:hypothetical protein